MIFCFGPTTGVAVGVVVVIEVVGVGVAVGAGGGVPDAPAPGPTPGPLAGRHLARSAQRHDWQGRRVVAFLNHAARQVAVAQPLDGAVQAPPRCWPAPPGRGAASSWRPAWRCA